MLAQIEHPQSGKLTDEVRTFQRLLLLSAGLLLATVFMLSRASGNLFPLYQVQAQDLGPLSLLAISLVVSAFWLPSWRLPVALHIRFLVLAAVCLVALLGWGTYHIMGNFPLSRDEHMVLFDMVVFDRRRLATPLPPEWRAYAHALVPAFLLNENMPTGLVSAYLPVNAVLRLAFSKIADPVFFNPVLAAVGAVALLDIARREFGKNDPACWVALLVYGLSAQMIVNAMTTYSMTAHMALNLVWLAAFLRGGKAGHAVAIGIGFLATGLHQIAFHPFFVAPILLWRLREGEWKLVAMYAGAYCSIIVWWAYYPIVAAHEVASSVTPPRDSNLLARVSALLVHRDGNPPALMFLNLVRFVAWQNFVLLPLLAVAAGVAFRERGLPGALFAGIGLWLVFIAIMLPYQGHGWGYRYLHPYLGSFALLCGYGYRDLTSRIGGRADGLVLGLSATTAVVAVPMLLGATYRFVEPHVSLERLVARQPTPIVLIDTETSPSTDGKWAPNAIDHVRNLPDLRNRPLRFSSRDLNAVQLVRLCRRAPVTLITRAEQQRVGFAWNVPRQSTEFDRLVRQAEHAVPSCFRRAVGVRA